MKLLGKTPPVMAKTSSKLSRLEDNDHWDAKRGLVEHGGTLAPPSSGVSHGRSGGTGS
jgi:hypothetical protein